MVAPRETAELAKRLIADTCHKQNIQPGQLTIQADRGSSMTSKPVAFLLADLRVTQSHSRPYVSDDNPYSESHFRTLKYRPDFRNGLVESRTAAPFARDSSLAITRSTATLASSGSHHRWFTTARRGPSSSKGKSCSMPRIRLTRNASYVLRLNHSASQRRSGSTNPQRIKVSKFRLRVSQIY